MTPEQIRMQFRAKGLTFAQWARERGFKPRDVSLVLNGQIKGHYGKSHEIAVALGLKPDHTG